jgi:hypothetical protein
MQIGIRTRNTATNNLIIRLRFSANQYSMRRPIICVRVVSVSRDQTCKVYSIAGGQLLLSVSFTTPLLSVTMDSASQDVYTGAVELLLTYIRV